MGKITTFYLVRHGQSQGNAKNIFVGHANLDLSPLGYEQAIINANALKTIAFDNIYSSDLQRAYHTVQPHASMRNMEIIKDERLRESNAGCWENKTLHEIATAYPEEWNTWLYDIGNSVTGYKESFYDVEMRVKNAILEIAKYEEGNTILVGTHATPIRALCAYAQGISLDEVKTKTKWPRNASYSIFQVDGSNIQMIEYDVCDFLADKVVEVDLSFK